MVANARTSAEVKEDMMAKVIAKSRLYDACEGKAGTRYQVSTREGEGTSSAAIMSNNPLPSLVQIMIELSIGSRSKIGYQMERRRKCLPIYVKRYPVAK